MTPARFLVSGVANTLATYLLYLLLLQVLSPRLSYTVSFLSGIGIAYLLSRHFVFRARGIKHSALLFPLIYFAQYLFGLAIVSFWVDVLALPTTLAPAIVIALTLPVTYCLSGRIFPRARGNESA